MKKYSLLTGMLCLFASLNLVAQALTLEFPDTTVRQSDSISIAMNAKDFLNIASIQHSIHWNPNVLSYTGNTEAGITGYGLGTLQAAEGTLRLSWFYPVQGEGLFIDDDDPVMYINFVVNGSVGDSTYIYIDGIPTEIQIAQSVDSSTVNFNYIDLVAVDGLVKIIEAFNLTSTEVTHISCQGENNGSIELNFDTAPSNSLFFWTGTNGYTSFDQDIYNLPAGEYSLVIEDPNGSPLFDSTFILVEPLLSMDVNTIETVASDCNGTTGTASIIMDGGSPPYYFDIGTNNSTNGEFSGMATGMYFLTVTDNNGCITTDNFTIPASFINGVDLGEDVSLCDGQSYDIDAGPGYALYEWSDGSTGQVLNILESGTYILTVTNTFQCFDTDTIEITFDPIAVTTVATSFAEICPGESIQLNADGGSTFQWLDDSNSLSATNIPNPQASPQAPTTYQVISTNECGSDTASVEIQVFEITSDAGVNACVAPGASIELQATGGVEYFWEESIYEFDDYTIANPLVTPLEDATFVVEIIDENNCSNIDSIKVSVASSPEEFVKRINLISPNGDLKNDWLEFKGIEKYGSNSLNIFNRWGELVYTKINYQIDGERFDGHYNEKELPAGVYYYVLSFRNVDLKQTLTIVR